MKWQNVVIVCTGVLVVGAVLITAMFLGKNGAILAGGLTIIASAVTGAVTYGFCRRSLHTQPQPPTAPTQETATEAPQQD